MRERSIPWTQAWQIASAELGGVTNRDVPIPRSATWAALMGGVLLVGLPSLIVQVIWPGWMSTSGSEAEIAAMVWLSLLGVSGVVIIGVAGLLSFRLGSSFAARLLLRVYIGVAVGMWLSVIVMGSASYDVGAAAALFSLFVGIPFWACAGIGIAIGSGLYATLR